MSKSYSIHDGCVDMVHHLLRLYQRSSFFNRSKLSHQKTVNGTRNPFAGREALDKRSASVFPTLARDRFLRQFIFQCHNFLIHRRCGVVVPVEHCFHSPSKHTEHNQKSH